MNNFNSISRGFNDLLQDEWIKGHPDTSREICRILNTQTPEVIAQSYTRGYHDFLCTQGVLFWKTISKYINSFVACYNTALQYLARDSYYPATHNAALCLKYTSLGYLMDLVYCGLLENHITQQHIQQIRDVTSDDKGLGLRIAGFDVDDYNKLIITITQESISTQSISKNSREETSTQSPSKKRIETISEESASNYFPDIQAISTTLKHCITKIDGVLTFTGSVKLYAYLVYKIKQRRGYVSIDWDRFMSLLPLQKGANKATLKKYVSGFCTGSNTSFPNGYNRIDNAINLLI